MRVSVADDESLAITCSETEADRLHSCGRVAQCWWDVVSQAVQTTRASPIDVPLLVTNMMTSSEIRRHTNSVEDEAVDEDDVDIDVTGKWAVAALFVVCVTGGELLNVSQRAAWLARLINVLTRCHMTLINFQKI